jgi:SMI1 / KNR4 family (SUKH-1)
MSWNRSRTEQNGLEMFCKKRFLNPFFESKKMNGWIETIVNQWIEEKIKLNLGVSIEQIEEAEKKIGFVFPAAFKTFYLRVNGFSNSDWNPNAFSVWSLEQIIEEYHVFPEPDFVAFCDFLMKSHHIGFVKGKTGIFKYYNAFEAIAETFEEGLMLINTDSELIY